MLTITDFEHAADLGVRVSGRAGTDFRWDAPRLVADAVAAGSLRVPVWRVEPWEMVAEVQEVLRSGSAHGKTVPRVST